MSNAATEGSAPCASGRRARKTRSRCSRAEAKSPTWNRQSAIDRAADELARRVLLAEAQELERHLPQRRELATGLVVGAQAAQDRGQRLGVAALLAAALALERRLGRSPRPRAARGQEAGAQDALQLELAARAGTPAGKRASSLQRRCAAAPPLPPWPSGRRTGGAAARQWSTALSSSPASTQCRASSSGSASATSGNRSSSTRAIRACSRCRSRLEQALVGGVAHQRVLEACSSPPAARPARKTSSAAGEPVQRRPQLRPPAPARRPPAAGRRTRARCRPPPAPPP